MLDVALMLEPINEAAERRGRPTEIFLSSRHIGSAIEAIARDCIPGRS
jgi:hypothetical protein